MKDSPGILLWGHTLQQMLQCMLRARHSYTLLSRSCCKQCWCGTQTLTCIWEAVPLSCTPRLEVGDSDGIFLRVTLLLSNWWKNCQFFFFVVVLLLLFKLSCVMVEKSLLLPFHLKFGNSLEQKVLKGFSKYPVHHSCLKGWLKCMYIVRLYFRISDPASSQMRSAEDYPSRLEHLTFL